MGATTLTVDGERIYVVDEGADHPDRTPILLIHGFPGSSLSWHRVTPLLVRSRHVIAPDLVGLGQSERRPRGPLTLSAQAQRMARLLGQLGITQADVVGISLGGGVAQKLVLEHPGRVRRLVLIAAIDTSVRFPTSTSDVLSLAVLLGLLRVPVYGERLVARGFRDAFHDPTKLTPELARGYLAPLRQPGTFGTLRRMWSNLGAEAPADLGAINVPTLVIGAAHDLPERGEPLARRIPGAQFVEIENAGHAVTFEQPEAIANAIARFLGSETVE